MMKHSMKVFHVVAPIALDGAVLDVIDGRVVLSAAKLGNGPTAYGATLDGRVIELAYALGLIKDAEDRGHCEPLEEARWDEPDPSEPIGRKAAHSLHKSLGALGIRHHALFAQVIVGRSILHLSDLTAEEAREVYRAAAESAVAA